MGEERELLVKISADISNLKKKTEQAKDTVTGFEAAGKKLALTLGLAFGARELFNFFKSTIDAAAEAEAVSTYSEQDYAR